MKRDNSTPDVTDWQRAVDREIGQTRRFLGVARETSGLSDDAVAYIVIGALVALGLMALVAPPAARVALIGLAIVGGIRLVWVLLTPPAKKR